MGSIEGNERNVHMHKAMQCAELIKRLALRSKVLTLLLLTAFVGMCHSSEFDTSVLGISVKSLGGNAKILNCGYNVTALCLKVFGISYSPEVLIRDLEVGENLSQAATFSSISDALAKRGVVCTGYGNVTIKDVLSAELDGLIIAHMSAPYGDQKVDHFVLWIKGKDSIVEYDYPKPPVEVSREQTPRLFTGNILVLRKENGMEKNGVIIDTNVDLGDIVGREQSVEFSVSFQNGDGQGVSIESVRHSCGCVRIERYDRHIPAGGTGVVKGRIDTSSEPYGENTKYLTISTRNDSGIVDVAQVALCFNLISSSSDNLRCFPSVIRFGRIGRSQSGMSFPRYTVKVLHHVQNVQENRPPMVGSLRLFSVSLDNENISAIQLGGQEHRVYEYVVTLAKAGMNSEGEIREEVVFESVCGERCVVSLGAWLVQNRSPDLGVEAE